ncbi:unnamed protein product [Microthlaspi erraticum]|uniref:Uncharacterized protein n=1 Tax=Microthlaspi erraticum TaxID=1685480 RepID=A0A6D2K6D9_9BRAS|nr:unnamed protein product [Microthlaspi erraticum]
MFQEAKNPRRAAAQQNPAIGTLLHKAKEKPVQNINKHGAQGATTGQRRIYMPNMRDEGNPTTIQSRRDRKTVRSKQNSIGPSKKGDITFTITLSARIDEPSDNARPSPKRHDRSPPNFTGDLKTSFWSANPKDRTRKSACYVR